MKALFLFLALTTSAYSQDFFAALEEQMDVIQGIRTATARDLNSGPCVRLYENLYKDGVLNIIIGFGYTDNVPGPVVFDWYQVNGLVRTLTGPCRSGISACEFTRSRQDPDRLTKRIQDRNGRSVTAEIVILRASLSGNHHSNISKENIARQNAFCQSVEDKFHAEIKKGAEIVLYSGHSRDGGGPDFCPPKVLANGKTNYPWYRKNKPGITKLVASLKAAQKPNQILFMHSCHSTPLFHQRVLSANPNIAYVGSDELLGMKPDFQNIYGGIDGILSLRCQRGLKASMSQGVGMDFHNLFINR